MSNRIYLSPPHLEPDAMELMTQTLHSNWIAPVGPNLIAWEEEIEKETKLFPVLTTSGEAAIEMALRLVGIGKGDTVITATHTCSATVNAILHLGAVPVFVDSDPNHWNMDASLLQEAIVDLKQKGNPAKAILFVSIYGNANGWESVAELAKQHGLPVVEDAAESVGSTLNGKFVGGLGVVGAWSFNGNKIITSGGGGAVVCTNKSDQIKVQGWVTQAKETRDYYYHLEVGHSYRMSNVLAAIGRSQWAVLEKRLASRKAIFNRYVQLWTDLNLLDHMQIQTEGNCMANHWLSVFIFDRKLGVDVTAFMAHMDALNIEVRRVWNPMHNQPVYSDCGYYGGNVAEDLFENGICLPSGSSLTQQDWTRITEAVSSFFKGNE